MKGRLCRSVVTATASPKRSRDVTVTGRGSADEAVVVVKLRADEDAVTYLRIKLSVNGSNAGGEGRNMLPRSGISLETVVMRSAIGAFFERIRIFSVIAKGARIR